MGWRARSGRRNVDGLAWGAVLGVADTSKPNGRASDRQVDPLPGLRADLAVWRTVRAGGREFVTLLPADDPAAAARVADALKAWRGARYAEVAPSRAVTLVRVVDPDPPPRWAWHAALLVLTILCALAAGAALAGAWYPWSEPGLRGAAIGAWAFVTGLAEGDWRYLGDGWSFALPLLAILLAHEAGHYLAARRYGMRVSPPWFLPVPPTLSPIGSLGAFITLRSPVFDRRQLVDVGAAGPLAGILVAVPVLVWGLLLSTRMDTAPAGASTFVLFAGQPIVLGDSLLTHWLGTWLVPGSGPVHLSLPAFAGWVGAFITTLNLLPLSQLDGGHVLYGLLGRRQTLVAFAAVAGLVALAQLSWSWYLWVILAFVVGRGRLSHPGVLAPHAAVPASRRVAGALCGLVFILTFVPVPFGR